MKPTRIATTLVTALAVLALVGPLGAQSARRESSTAGTGPQRPSWNHYQPIIDRNIFLRERSSGRRAVPSAPREGGTLLRPAELALRGFMEVNGQTVALFEDTGSGSIRRLSAGDALPTGRITRLNLDHVLYEDAQGRAARLEIGQGIPTGQMVTAAGGASGNGNTGSSTSDRSSSSGAASDSRGGSGESSSDLLERMRARRQQELSR